MADEKYIIPPEPAYRLHGIRRLQNTDPGNADKVLNPVIEPILESVEYLNRHKTGQAQGHGPPGPATPGGAGGHYFDIDNGMDYLCTGRDENGWLWRLAGGRQLGLYGAEAFHPCGGQKQPPRGDSRPGGGCARHKEGQRQGP